MVRAVLPRTMAISSGSGSGLEAWLDLQIAAGVDAVQLREKQLGDRALFELTRRLVAAASGRCQVLVNGRADLALAAGADGVHLPASGLPAGPLRRRCGQAFLIGRSTHTPREVERALAEGCDYALFGPLRPTPSKPGLVEPPGLSGLADATRLGLPLLALGGVEKPAELAAAAAAGAVGIAGIRGFAVAASAQSLARAAQEQWPR